MGPYCGSCVFTPICELWSPWKYLPVDENIRQRFEFVK
jgi:hypothetical protein